MTPEQLLIELKRSVDPTVKAQLADELLQQVGVHLLSQHRFYGELSTRITRRVDWELPSEVELSYHHRPEVVVNPDRITSVDGVERALIHVLLHLVFRHPLRYHASAQQLPVKLATDVVVNAAMPQAPDGGATYESVAYDYGVKLPQNADSNQLIFLLSQQLPKTRQHQAGAINHPRITQVDQHREWQTFAEPAAAGQVAGILQTAWVHTPEKQRGDLPGRVQHALSVGQMPVTWDWRQLVVNGLGRPSTQREPAYNRFNRRQPRRLELPGSRPRLQCQLIVCVDESGSMTDDEVGVAMGQLMTILPRFDQPIMVVPFDAVVHVDALQELRAKTQLKPLRYGGGGTRFQSVFDWLASSGYDDSNATVLMMTDGHGERVVDQYRMTNVIWGLTTNVTELSVKRPLGRVTSLL